MDEEMIKKLFEKNVGTDADYFLIFYRNALEWGWDWNTVPRQDPPSKYIISSNWETIEEAISTIFTNSHWTKIEIYDLYSPFESALIKTVTKDSFFN